MHGHRDPGVKEGTLPDRLSGVRNVETPLESGLFQSADRKGGPILQWDEDDPRSEGRPPQGEGKS
jgi:hypothetical protein